MYHDFPDPPDIRNTILTGYPDGKDNSNPICPVCGEECDTIYKSLGSVVGCDVCIDSMDAWDWKTEQEERDDE